MEIDLAKLREMHPMLGLSTAREYVHRAAIGLGRHGHQPDTLLQVERDAVPDRLMLRWPEAGAADASQRDFNRVTEDAAEAIGLAVAHACEGWVLRRRLQRGGFADWLLVAPDAGLVAMEVSGVDTVDTRQRRLREKVDQVGRCRVAGIPVACVAELGPPRTRMQMAPRR